MVYVRGRLAWGVRCGTGDTGREAFFPFFLECSGTTGEVRMDGQFIVSYLGVHLFSGPVGAAFRGRFGRGLGLVTLALGLAGLLYGALTTTYRDGYGAVHLNFRSKCSRGISFRCSAG